ncbi:protein tyrosine phosphatase type IVA 3 isoform X2 [Salmo salar]|uniref:Protein tyrosine phosphatase type IVA 3 isoform X2 n=1 Tax=Salmo salar TaxID=8030 RepID=A0A1S3Q243_SALSA|nr:protein tyrosine phosphatase type IVA 3 isoform X2 [Salmo salar]XP_029588539.1 protein tyrosine phosphatase type IVA 3-like isoform X2 [Salmo trutta]|eukprot:XP_014034038.1 PREDICTED: protein tyrosine phosphatase type IVA 3-like isoform X2 [Salmo salar]
MARMNRPAPAEVCYKNMRLLITHNPTNSTLNSFIEDLKKYGATTVVRVCEVTYDKAPLEKDGITVVDWQFDDGAPPPSKVVEDWLSLLRSRFLEDPGCCVAVHCVAGLGRKRRGAINSKQLTYLEKYRPKQRLRYKDPHIFKNKCCVM